MTPRLFNRRRLALSAVLFVLLASIYLVTYSGFPESGDSLQIFDALSSALIYGDLRLDQSAWQFRPFPDGLDTADPLPLLRVITEPMQMIAAAPLFSLARLVPEWGLAHTVWLLNVIVCAAVCVVFYWLALVLGYTDRVSIAGALTLGLATALWPYSRSFFREPLLALSLLSAALCLERLRAGGYRSGWLLLGAGLALVAALLTKASAVLAFPALLMLVAPAPRAPGKRGLWLIAAVLAGAAALFLLLGPGGLGAAFSGRYDLLARLQGIDTRAFGTAFSGYLLSPGGSIWGTSPVLLLAVPGLVLWLRGGQRRYPLFLITLLLSFVAGYALLNGGNWFGGLSWPPRFLVPLLPLLMLGSLPVWARLLRRPVSWWWLPVSALLAYSLFIQVVGASLDWARYLQVAPVEANGLLEWRPGLYDPAFFRWVLMPQWWAQGVFDTAWHIARLPWMTAALLGLAAVSAVALGWMLVRARRRQSWVSAGLVVALGLLTAVGLRTLYHQDERYRAWDDTLFAMLPLLETQTRPDDLVLLSGPDFSWFFLNYDKRSAGGRVVALPFQPGEQPSPEQPPEIVSDNPDDLIAFETRPLLIHLALNHDRLWLLAQGGPDLWYSRRPVERYLSANHYPVQTLATGPITRLLEFDSTRAPAPFAFFNADLPAALVFDETVLLAALHLPAGATVRAGEVLPVSLSWSALAPLTPNYSAALFLRGMDGAPVAQSDAQPGGGFTPTSQWPPGQTVWDHRGLRVPPETPPGDYQLWVKVYDFGPDGAPRDAVVTAGRSLERVIGVLPVTIRVEQRAR
jgi:hypothetical protein